MTPDFPGVTRLVRGADGDEILAVRRASLRVVRGPDAGRELDLGERTSALIGTDADADLVLSDDSVSRRHAELRAVTDGYLVIDLGSTNGTALGGALVERALLTHGPLTLSLGETDVRFTLGGGEVEHRLSASTRFGSVIGRSPAMRELFARLERAAASDSTVLLEGESGTGKEALAQSIHAASPRAAAPLVVVDCSAIPATLIESELFGHVKGAFTGAVGARAGAFEEAHGGTLFLDEIGELPLELQPRFLRAIERREVKRVGAGDYRAVDVRIVAATNRDLGRRVAEGAFRSDLYYRLAVVQMRVPPLRQRPEDIVPLAEHLVGLLRPGAPPALERLLTPGTVAAFRRYDWPGNVRELRNALERLLLGDAPLGDLVPAAGDGAPGEYHQARRDVLDRFERDYCRRLLAAHDGVVSRAAAHAGLSRQMLYHLMKKHELDGADSE